MAGNSDIHTFESRMAKLAKNLRENAKVITRKAALAVDTAVVLATPVDTGRARANWQVRLAEPAQGLVDSFPEGKEGSTGGPAAQAAIAQGKAVIEGFQGGTSIHVTNNLPYIGKLNDGWSAQAPAGFVQKAILKGVAAVKGARAIVSARLT